MKLATQSDFFIQNHGLEGGLKHLKNIGYDAAVYTIADRYDAPFTTQWGDKELEEHFSPIGKAFADHGIKIVYTVIGNEFYNHMLPDTYEARKKMCLQCVKATHYLGCDTLAVKPSNSPKQSKEYTFEVFELIKTECDKLGITLAVINNAPLSAGQRPYGCDVRDLVEAADRFNARVIVNPAHAWKANRELDRMIEEVGDRLIGVMINDIEPTVGNPFIPMMGSVDYMNLIEQLKSAPADSYGVMISAPIYKRYEHFNGQQNVFDALDHLLYQIGSLVTGNLKA